MFLSREMSEAEMGSVLKQALKRLCCSNGWCYGVFWRFDKRNSLLLTFEDAYYEDQMGTVVNHMLLQVHMLGKGIIGQAALAGSHSWVFFDTHGEQSNSIGSVTNQDIFQEETSTEFHHQFSSGIKTIVTISVGSRGVVQFGSTQKVLESLEFLDQTKRMLQGMESIDGLIPLEHASSSSDFYDLDGLFATLIASENSSSGNLVQVYGGSSTELIGNAACLSASPSQSSFTSDFFIGNMTPMHGDSCHVFNQLQTDVPEAQGELSSKPNTKIQSFGLPTSSVNNSVDNVPSNSAWSNDSILAAFEPISLPEKGMQDLPGVFVAKTDTLVSRGSAIKSCLGESNVSLKYQYRSGKLTPDQNCPLERAIDHPNISEKFKEADLLADISSAFAVDDLTQWFALSPEYDIDKILNAANDYYSQPLHVMSESFGLIGLNSLADNPIKCSAKSAQCSDADTVISDGQEVSMIIQNVENDLFDAFGLSVVCHQSGESWEETLMPVVSAVRSASSSGVAELKSEFEVGFKTTPQEGLFSEGLNELLDSVGTSSSTKSGLEEHFSTTKRRKVEGSSSNCNQVELVKSLSCSAGSMNLKQPSSDWNKLNNNGSKKEVLPKSQVGLWIDDSYSINAGNAVIKTTKKLEEPMNTNRKRARPGESTRPRPKDRQQIQDRIKELRGIIPNGAKCSIDALLDLTIKYMLFLQSVTKYADKLKQTNQPKLIDRQHGLLKDSNGESHGDSSDVDGGGATWAFEVGGETMFCPIIVEDLSPPGHMLIEMLCEEQGYFLEIADNIRGFGLNILKGVMEVRKSKIWAHFVVVANKHVTRLDIFWFLVQLLHQTDISEIDSTNQGGNIMDSTLNGCQQPLLPPPMNLAMTYQLGAL